MSQVLVIGDTNVAYILFFFTGKAVILAREISLASGCILKFHPVVQREIQAHMEAWHVCNQLEIEGTFPSFFNDIKAEGMADLDKFVTQNMAEIPAVDTNSKAFFNKRKVYEAERIRLQQAWRQAGTIGRKVKSQPSNADYSILFSAETRGDLIATNDEILLAVAQEFLSEDCTLKAEDIVNDFFRKDSSTKKAIEDVAAVLSYLGLPFNLARALK